MRGKAPAARLLLLAAGITPAYAGKSADEDFHQDGAKDHPRVCGEKKKMNMRKDKRMGSPPRMRGKVIQPEERNA